MPRQIPLNKGYILVKRAGKDNKEFMATTIGPNGEVLNSTQLLPNHLDVYTNIRSNLLIFKGSERVIIKDVTCNAYTLPDDKDNELVFYFTKNTTVTLDGVVLSIIK
jgi:hypothetical protein